MPRATKMFKPAQYVSEFVSLAVMILMAVAVVAGQANASVKEASTAAAMEFHQAIEDRFSIDFEGRLGAKAVRITIAVVSDIGQFRGENE